MRAKEFLHKMLSSVIHKKQLNTLSLLIEGVIKNKKLSLTELARSITLPIQERSAIKRVDRFLSNKKLYQDREKIYQIYIKQILGENIYPVVIVDWSQIPNSDCHVLRAAYATKGRALVLYEEVHSEKSLGNSKVQINFLNKLNNLMPFNCKPVVITDAGFYNDWFIAVLNLGWDYVGRIRGFHNYFSGKNWKKCRDLFAEATNQATCLGQVNLCQKNTIETKLFLFKENKIKRRKYGRKSRTNAESYRRAADEPWLLASSIYSNTFSGAQYVISLYKQRMQIEEGFRDLKSSRYGLSFEHSYTKKPKRIEILLLLGMFACLFAYLVGIVAENLKMHQQFQVNTLKRRVLSFFFLGCRVINRKIRIPIDEFNNSLVWVNSCTKL